MTAPGRPGETAPGEGLHGPAARRSGGEPVRARAVVRGLVQGVSFRDFTRREAARVGVTGWVKNRADASVELVAEGPREAVERLLTWARRGPSMAEVEDVEVSWEPFQGEFSRFIIRL